MSDRATALAEEIIKARLAEREAEVKALRKAVIEAATLAVAEKRREERVRRQLRRMNLSLRRHMGGNTFVVACRLTMMAETCSVTLAEVEAWLAAKREGAR